MVPTCKGKDGLFSHTDDFSSLTEVAKNYPSVQEIEVNDKDHYQKLIEIANTDKDIIPLFLKDNNDEFIIISSYNTEIKTIQDNSKLVYLGKPFDVEKV